MNMQQMMAQAQKLQRELQKAHEEINTKEFVVSKNGLVTLTILGNKSIKAITIEKDALDPENKEMIEEAIILAYSDALVQIDRAIGDANERITGRREGLGF